VIESPEPLVDRDCLVIRRLSLFPPVPTPFKTGTDPLLEFPFAPFHLSEGNWRLGSEFSPELVILRVLELGILISGRSDWPGRDEISNVAILSFRLPGS
jgi:hypothetical protein